MGGKRLATKEAISHQIARYSGNNLKCFELTVGLEISSYLRFTAFRTVELSINEKHSFIESFIIENFIKILQMLYTVQAQDD